MGLEVTVVKARRGVPVAPAFVRGVLEGAASVIGGAGEVTVRVTGDRELRRLNREFLGHDEATDVLSFPGGEPYLGDIAVSWPAVERQAAEFGHGVEAELAVLCVHGFLHLLGWDHATLAEEGAMWEATERCLRAAGVRGVAPGRLPRRLPGRLPGRSGRGARRS